MATRQKPTRSRVAGGRQTTQQQSRREQSTVDTGYDSSNMATAQFRREKMEGDSREELAKYIKETIKDAGTLTELGMVPSPTVSQNLTLQQDDDSHDLHLHFILTRYCIILT